MPEHYDATVSDTTIFPKPDVLFVKLNYEIINFKGGPFTVAELTPLHADRNSPKYAETVKGKARVKAILEINDKDVTTIGIEDVPLLFKGLQSADRDRLPGHRWARFALRSRDSWTSGP